MKNFILLCLFCSGTVFANEEAKQQLNKIYTIHCISGSDINEHIPILCRLAKECSSTMEIGVRSMNSTWGILQGLSESDSFIRQHIAVDLSYPPFEILTVAEKLAKENAISFQFIQANDMAIDISSIDMLFIDSLHTYLHLSYELEKFSPHVKKYIAMHDTSAPWGDMDEMAYLPEAAAAYPEEISREARGLWPAVVNFLENHPEWTLKERHFNNHGFTVLERISE